MRHAAVWRNYYSVLSSGYGKSAMAFWHKKAEISSAVSPGCRTLCLVFSLRHRSVLGKYGALLRIISLSYLWTDAVAHAGISRFRDGLFVCGRERGGTGGTDRRFKPLRAGPLACFCIYHSKGAGYICIYRRTYGAVCRLYGNDAGVCRDAFSDGFIRCKVMVSQRCVSDPVAGNAVLRHGSGVYRRGGLFPGCIFVCEERAAIGTMVYAAAFVSDRACVNRSRGCSACAGQAPGGAGGMALSDECQPAVVRMCLRPCAGVAELSRNSRKKEAAAGAGCF